LELVESCKSATPSKMDGITVVIGYSDTVEAVALVPATVPSRWAITHIAAPLPDMQDKKPKEEYGEVVYGFWRQK